MTKSNQKPSTLLTILTYFCSAYAALYLVSIIILTILVLLKVTKQPVGMIFMYIWFFTSGFTWWVFIIGIISGIKFKQATKINNKPTPLARFMVIINIAALAGIPISIIMILVGYALTCSGNC